MSLLPALVKGIIAEAAREIFPVIIDKVKRKLADNGVPVDAVVEKLMELQLAQLHAALRNVVDEFDAAEARGKAHPLGGGAIDFIECCACPPPTTFFSEGTDGARRCVRCNRPEFVATPDVFETDTPAKK